jgi:hypothetical protein
MESLGAMRLRSCRQSLTFPMSSLWSLLAWTLALSQLFGLSVYMDREHSILLINMCLDMLIQEIKSPKFL